MSAEASVLGAQILLPESTKSEVYNTPHEESAGVSLDLPLDGESGIATVTIRTSSRAVLERFVDRCLHVPPAIRCLAEAYPESSDAEIADIVRTLREWLS